MATEEVNSLKSLPHIKSELLSMSAFECTRKEDAESLNVDTCVSSNPAWFFGRLKCNAEVGGVDSKRVNGFASRRDQIRQEEEEEEAGVADEEESRRAKAVLQCTAALGSLPEM